METYTEEEVNKIIKTTIKETVEGVINWIEAETNIVDIDTSEVLPNTQIELKPDANPLMQKYICPILEKHGITFINNI